MCRVLRPAYIARPIYVARKPIAQNAMMGGARNETGKARLMRLGNYQLPVACIFHAGPWFCRCEGLALLQQFNRNIVG